MEMCQPVLCGSTYCFIGYHWFGGVLYKEKTDLGAIPCTTNKMLGFQYKLCISDTLKTYGGIYMFYVGENTVRIDVFAILG